MSWSSVELITAIDLAVIAVGIHVGILACRRRGLVDMSGMTGGLGLVAAGLFLIVAFFAADLFGLWLLPHFIAPKAAMSASETLRLNFGWFVLPIAACVIALGLARASRAESTEQSRASEIGPGEGAERYRLLIEASPDAILVTGHDRMITFANSAAVGLFGAESVDRLIGLNMLELVHPEDREDVEMRRRLVLQGVQPAFAVRRRLRLDGTEFYSESHGVPFIWGGGSAILIVVRDITERRLAEQALRKSEARFRDLIEGSHLGIQISAAGDRYLYVNQALLDLFGYASQQEIPRTRGSLIAGHDRERVDGYVDERRKGEHPPDIYEFDGLRKDATIVPVQVFVRRIVWEGRDAVQRTFIDLTERKEAEGKLRQAQKMEAVGQLTAGVAHDFNNLLTVVLGNLGFLQNEFEGRATRQHDLVRRATAAAKRGAELTQQLLAFSRKQSLKPEPLNVSKIVSGTTELLRRTLGEAIEIETVTDARLWLCEADPGQITDVLVNLSVNARDAMPDGGKLTIESANAQLDDDYAASQIEVEPGQYVMLSVTDTGTGMPPEVKEKAFEPFFTTKEVGKGTGLGLSMVYGFVKQSGGHVAICSEEGEGTTIKIYLPRIEAEENPAQEVSASTDNLRSRGETVFVVEDDPDLRTLAVDMLTELDYAVLQAETGASALEQLQTAGTVNLLLTDVVLPGGMSGRELADEVQRRFKGIRVLYMSGYSEKAIIHHGRLDPGVELLQKPFSVTDLLYKVRSVLDAPLVDG